MKNISNRKLPRVDKEILRVRNMDDENLVATEILRSLKTLEARTASLEQKCVALMQKVYSIEATKYETKKSKSVCLQHHLARHVNSIVGLEEALTWKHRPIKIIWAILVFLGSFATVYYICNTAAEYFADPTATTVKLESRYNYSYPHVVLCPPTWLDAEKAFSMGLTIPALQYSLGFYEQYAIAPRNVTAAREEFHRFFHSQNFSSLIDFYKAIAVDVALDKDLEEHENRSISSSMCDGCDDAVNAQKVFKFPYGVCYAYKFLPLGARRRGWASWSTTQTVSAKIADKTQGVHGYGANWQMYFMPNLDLIQPSSLPVTLQPYSFFLIKLSVQKISNLPSAQNPCKLDNELQQQYSAETCLPKCMNEHASTEYGCKFLAWSTEPDSYPAQYCNAFDQVTMGNASAMFKRMEEVEKSKLNSCFDQCPQECEQTIYDYQFVFHGPVNPNFYPIINLTRAWNMTFVDLGFISTALSQGGVLTIKEFSTFSFTTLVANVGGTLGLFVGCTILTLAQIILSLVSYFCLSEKGTEDNCG